MTTVLPGRGWTWLRSRSLGPRWKWFKTTPAQARADSGAGRGRGPAMGWLWGWAREGPCHTHDRRRALWWPSGTTEPLGGGCVAVTGGRLVPVPWEGLDGSRVRLPLSCGGWETHILLPWAPVWLFPCCSPKYYMIAQCSNDNPRVFMNWNVFVEWLSDAAILSRVHLITVNV